MQYYASANLISLHNRISRDCPASRLRRIRPTAWQCTPLRLLTKIAFQTGDELLRLFDVMPKLPRLCVLSAIVAVDQLRPLLRKGFQSQLGGSQMDAREEKGMSSE